tara:strand:+ start:961 stop:1668 length:708 start_codon:yes stop_codon:yes gene_type:complete
MSKTTIKLILTMALSFGVVSSTYAEETDLYDFLWLDPDKKVYVLQNKIYPKTKTIYFDIGYLSNDASKFQDTTAGQIRLGYFFNEELGIEINHAQYGSSNNSAYENVKAVNGLEPFIRRPLTSTSLFLIWSPFYGKINTFNKIFYFDWYFGLGTGTYEMETNLEKVVNPGIASQFESETFTPIQLKSGLKFHINRRLHLGVEYINTNFQAGSAERPTANDWKQSNDLVFSMGVSF